MTNYPTGKTEMFKVHKKSYQSLRKKNFLRSFSSRTDQFNQLGFFLIRLSQPIPLLQRACFFS